LVGKENIAINQPVTPALGDKVSALMTEDYLAQRAQAGAPEVVNVHFSFLFTLFLLRAWQYALSRT